MEKPQTSKARRPHRKSRKGCIQCKQRKVKCDERKPICTRCEGYGTPCSFLQTHPQKSTLPVAGSSTQSPLSAQAESTSPIQTSQLTPPLLPPLQGNFTVFDLKLLYFWITEGAAVFVDFGNDLNIFSDVIIKYALEHEFLMHEILSLAALHLSRIKPQGANEYLFASDTHRVRALSLFQPEVAKLNEVNCQACFLFSIITFIHAWASQDMNSPSTLFFIPSRMDKNQASIKWIGLHRGSHSIMESLFPLIRGGDLMPLFTPWDDLDPDRKEELEENDEREFERFAEALRSSAISEEHRKILLETLGTVKTIFSLLSFYPQISKLSAIMSWFTIITDEFLKMLEEKIPEALILVAHYAISLKRLPHMWWMEGKAESLLMTVLDELGDEWEPYTRWPIEQIMGTTDRRNFLWGINELAIGS